MLSSKLPKDYLPFEELEICSNQLINGKIPIEVHKNAILLIGRGKQPAIWLSGLVTNEGKQFQEIVEKNHSLNKSVDVKVSPENNSTIVKVGEITIIEATKVLEQKAIVSKMDLRPLGLNIYGDSNGLLVATNKLIGNIFTNVHTMVGIGK